MSPFTHPTFRLLWSAGFLWSVGGLCHETAAAWELGRMNLPPTVVALLQTAASLPVFLFALPSGALADIMDRRRLLIITQLFGAAAALALAITSWAGLLSSWAVLVTAAAMGMALAFTMPAWQGAMAEIVSKDQMPSAVTWGGVSMNASRILGPLIGGWLVASAGAGWAFAVNALSFGLLALALLKWKRVAPVRKSAPEDIVGAMIAAGRYTLHSRPMQFVLLRGGAFALAGIAPVALMPLLTRDLPGMSGARYGMLMSVYGCGALMAALVLLPWFRKRMRADVIVALASLVSAACAAAMPLMRVWGPMGLIAPLFVAGAAWVIAFVSCSVALQSTIPHWVRSRGSAVYLLVFQGCLALGAFVWGQIAEFATLPAAYFTAAAALVLGAVLAKIAPLECALHQVTDAAPLQHQHAFPHQPQPEDGPVLVTIDYTVTAAQQPRFRELMARLGEVRQRDGARRWVLWHSLDTPDVFREIMVVNSWAEHLRQHERRTETDRELEDLIHTLHIGPEIPMVRHFLESSEEKAA